MNSRTAYLTYLGGSSATFRDLLTPMKLQSNCFAVATAVTVAVAIAIVFDIVAQLFGPTPICLLFLTPQRNS